MQHSVTFLPQSSNVGKNSDGGISDFRISGQSFMKENCHNSIDSDNIDRKIGPVTKIDKRNKAMSKKINNESILANFDVIVIFSIYGKSGAIRKQYVGAIVCKTYTFINSKP